MPLAEAFGLRLVATHRGSSAVGQGAGQGEEGGPGEAPAWRRPLQSEHGAD